MIWTRLLIVLGVVAAVYFGHAVLKTAYIKQGYDQAVNEYNDASAERLRKAQQAWAAANDRVATLQGEINATRKQLEDARARVRDGERKLREAQADFDQRVATASAESLRRYATSTRDHLLGCRADVERFGFEAAAAAATAHTLKKELDIALDQCHGKR